MATVCFVVVPVRTGPRVEQHADDRQVDHGVHVEVCGAVDAADFEVPPTAVERDVEVGEPRAGGRGDLVRGAFQGCVVHGEPA